MISNQYKKIIEDLNGVKNFGKRKKIPKLLDSFLTQCKPRTLLDFGCGTGNLIKTLEQTYPNIQVFGYDPGNEFYSRSIDNSFFDMIISTDVLEHIEPEFLDTTLKFLADRSKYMYHLIALEPSSVFLPDGRNAHLILESPNWWRNKFLNLGYKITNEHHMMHKKEERLVNKFFIMGVK